MNSPDIPSPGMTLGAVYVGATVATMSQPSSSSVSASTMHYRPSQKIHQISIIDAIVNDSALAPAVWRGVLRERSGYAREIKFGASRRRPGPMLSHFVFRAGGNWRLLFHDLFHPWLLLTHFAWNSVFIHSGVFFDKTWRRQWNWKKALKRMTATFKPALQRVVERIAVVESVVNGGYSKAIWTRAANPQPVLTLHNSLTNLTSVAQAVLYGDLDMQDVWHHTLGYSGSHDEMSSLSRISHTPWARLHGPPPLVFGNPRLSEQAEAELLTWLDGQTNVVSLRFPFLVDGDDEDVLPPTLLPTTPTRIRLLSAPTTPSQPFLFPMPPLSPLPPTPTPTQDMFTHARHVLSSSSHPSRPLIDASITISTPIYDGFRPTTTLESLPPSVRHLRFAFKSVGKRTEEKTLRSAVVVCPAIEELEIQGDAGEACWYSIVPHFKSLRVLIMRKPGIAQVPTSKEALDERFPLPKPNERAARLANACPALQHVVFPNGVQWRRPSASLLPLPRSRSSPCLPFDDLFVKKINRDVPPPLPPKVVPLTEQRFMKREECFDLNDSDDDDSLFYKPTLRKESSSIQGCHEHVEVNVRGAGKMVMASLTLAIGVHNSGLHIRIRISAGQGNVLTSAFGEDVFAHISTAIFHVFFSCPTRDFKQRLMKRSDLGSLFSEKGEYLINHDVLPPLPPKLTEQRFTKREQYFGLNDSDDDDSLFCTPSLRKESSVDTGLSRTARDQRREDGDGASLGIASQKRRQFYPPSRLLPHPSPPRIDDKPEAKCRAQSSFIFFPPPIRDFKHWFKKCSHLDDSNSDSSSLFTPTPSPRKRSFRATNKWRLT
ncbi:hypothetical protein IW261DRAFT_1597272 [Armillaria novae-zelandiae]|uniref:Uncharacterized protein n=1 Tax=Armillaria novae-zelandiae TaxID=153914 RepID=A0AA39NTC5_9AGAR|nr:hypothetical protein IW261DRAFT_1597272 [Armillaria novae-zelandiae]